ncbi:DNA topoisomerase IV [Aquimarina sp. 2-A2]|uniref:DNA topoisomerase IV n=1 Tax=Aquimarina sp. 2-A2 TaxID=3382644 RepID=UPI00387F04FB
MKPVYFIWLTLLIATGCFEQKRDCENFHVGTFEFETYLNGELAKTTFVRNDSIEIDSFLGKQDTSSIRWINACEYIVKKIHPKNRAEEKAIHMKILTTTSNTYTFEYGLVGSSEKQKGTAKKIN